MNKLQKVLLASASVMALGLAQPAFAACGAAKCGGAKKEKAAAKKCGAAKCGAKCGAKK